MSFCSTATGSPPLEGLTLISISAVEKALGSVTQPGPWFPTVQPGAGATEMPGASSIPSAAASVTAGRLMAVVRAIAAVAAAAMASGRTPRPTHPQRRGCRGGAGVRLPRGPDTVVALGVDNARMA